MERTVKQSCGVSRSMTFGHISKFRPTCQPGWLLEHISQHFVLANPNPMDRASQPRCFTFEVRVKWPVGPHLLKSRRRYLPLKPRVQGSFPSDLPVVPGYWYPQSAQNLQLAHTPKFRGPSCPLSIDCFEFRSKTDWVSFLLPAAHFLAIDASTYPW